MILRKIFPFVFQSHNCQEGLLFDSSVMLMFLLSLASLSSDDLMDSIRAYMKDSAHMESECHVLDLEKFA